MSDRCLASLGALAIVVAVVSLAPGSVAGQASAAGAKAKKTAATKTWTPPLTEKAAGGAMRVTHPASNAAVSQGAAPHPLVTPAAYERWQVDLSNWGRWGKDDEMGRSTSSPLRSVKQRRRGPRHFRDITQRSLGHSTLQDTSMLASTHG